MIYLGCTTNLISKQVFDKLLARIQAWLEDSSFYGVVVDGTWLTFCGALRLLLLLHDVKTVEVFLLSRINLDTIIIMSFLFNHHLHSGLQRTSGANGRKFTKVCRLARAIVDQQCTSHLRIDDIITITVCVGYFLKQHWQVLVFCVKQ